MNTLEIKMTVKQVYGRDTYYPFNELAYNLCKLLKQKTFTMQNIVDLKAASFQLSTTAKQVDFSNLGA